METVVRIHNESEYNEILQQAVAVIETARGNAARAIVSTSNEMHWRIGQLLYERKLDSKHGDNVVKRLSADLKAAYPKMGMSVSNLWNMKRLYVRFHNSDPKLQQAVVVLPRGDISIISLLNLEMMTMLFFITPRELFKKDGAGHYWSTL